VMPMEVAALKQGEAICHITASGGGFGDPLERSPEKVQEDVRQERITIDYARDVYGVIIDANTMAIDEAATQRQRKELAKEPRQALQDSALRHFLHTVGVTATELSGTEEP
jgi:N-methylhydantoinase B/oxoprolinase/acetone carboxylase alpha subunit